MRLETKIQLACLLGIALLIVSMIGCAYVEGGRRERTKEVIEEAGEAVAGAVANKIGAQAAANETSDLAIRASERQQEAADARREFERYAAPPAPGTVGPGAVVDAGFGRTVLCRIERVRRDAEAPNCRAAAADAHAGPT